MKRRISKVKSYRITPEAIEAFVSNAPGLDHMLGLKPWEPRIADVTTDNPPTRAKGIWADAWPKVRALRLALEKEAKSG
jgi:hypothetical protein